MLLKNLSYLFKAFDQSSEMDFFSFLVHRLFFYLFLFCFILSIYKKRECLEVTVFLVLFNLHGFTGLFFFFFGMRKATVVLQNYFCFVQIAIFHKIIKY